MNFASDNIAPVHPKVFEVLQKINTLPAMPYGSDDETLKLERKIKQLFGNDALSYPVTNGTSANSLALSCLCNPYEAVICHSSSHIYNDECNAPEMFTGGARLIPLSGENGKLSVPLLQKFADKDLADRIHSPRISAISITQLSESGTAYSVDEIKAIADFAHKNSMFMHVDGARLANACVSLGVSLKEMLSETKVDILSFGFTKNAAIAAELVVFLNPSLATEFLRKRKRGGQLWSKMRYLSGQINALLEDDLWLNLAKHSNSYAKDLEAIFNSHQISATFPVNGNQVFVELNDKTAKHLQDAGLIFYRWKKDPNIYRFMTSWNTKETDFEELTTALKSL